MYPAANDEAKYDRPKKKKNRHREQTDAIMGDLADQVERLKSEVTSKSNDLVLAAEIGKKLLEQNQDLEDRCEQLAEDSCRRIEQLEQDKYSLQIRLTALDRQLAEVDSLRESLQSERESFKISKRAEMAKSKETQKIQERMEELQKSLERSAMTEEHLRAKMKQQQDMLQEAHAKLNTLDSAPSQNEDHLDSLHHELTTIQSEKDVLEIELKDAQNTCQQLEFTIDVGKQRHQRLQDEVEEREQQATGYYNMLEKTREELMDVQLQLDAAKMDATDVNKRGNSLFAEVEDRRKEAENRMISLKVQYETAKGQLNMKKQQVHKMRFQIAALLQMGGNRADSSQIERLEHSLAQSRSEVHMLSDKIKTLEKEKGNEGLERNFDEYKQLVSETKKPDLVGFFQHKLTTAKAEHEDVKKALHTQQLLQIAASDKLMNSERRLYNAEMETDRTRAANMKLLVTIDELKAKVTGKDASSKCKVKTGYREKICLRKSNDDETTTDVNPTTDHTTESSTNVEPSSNEKMDPASADSTTEALALGGKHTVSPFILKPSNHNRRPLATDDRPPVAVIKKQTKKSVSMCETVSLMDAQGQTTMDLKSDDGGRGKRNAVACQENEESDGGARYGGKKHHKVVHMKSNSTAECKQQ